MAKQFVMNSDSWLKIRKIFADVIELPSGARDEYLLQTCGENASLRKEVEKLLAAHQEDSYLEPPQEFTGNSLLDNAAKASSPPPERVGRYRLLESIGSGGMGQIYRAVRDDREYEKEVAVKLIKRGMDTDEILRRFRTERQTLATLDHPNIARLLDGGTSRDGLPYLVMEYVNGVPIDKYCDREKLSITERLKLFQQVCSAVEYAHRNLIVHRDIKPGNILVTPEGVPKLLDFGIAKLLGNESSGLTVTTVSSMKMMTPRYASPEQIMGRSITTATDVYSLGVVLYELLTGRSPYSCDTQSRNSIERQIIQFDPERPSASVRRDTTTFEGETTVASIEAVCASRNITRDKLRKLLKRDLDTIVMTALHKETDRRYASVEQLSEDIRRYLGGLPIVAEADSLLYVAGKFIRRHKSVVAVSVLAFVILIAGVIGTTTAMFRAQEAVLVAESATDKANSELKKANEIRQFLQDMLAAANPENEGRNVTVREVLDQTSKRVDAELDGEPAVCEAVHRTIGQTYLGLGLYKAARFHLEKAHELVQVVYGIDSMEFAESREDLVDILLKFPRNEGVANCFSENRILYEQKFGKNSDLVGLTYANNAEIMSNWHMYESAVAEYRNAFAVFNTNGLTPSARVLRGFGTALVFSGRFPEGNHMLYQALEISKAVHGERSVETASVLHSLACMYDCREEYGRAERLFRDALDIRENILGVDHPALAVTLLSIGDIRYLKGDFTEAGEYYKRAVAIRKKNKRGAKILIKESLAYRALGDYENYEKSWHEGNRYWEILWGSKTKINFSNAWAFEDGAYSCGIHGINCAVEFCIKEALDSARFMVYSRGEGQYYTLELLSSLLNDFGALYINSGNIFPAERYINEVLLDRRDRLWKKHWLIGQSLYYHGRIKFAQFNPMAATNVLQKALEILQVTLPDDHRLIACTRSSLGQCLVSLGQYNDGKTLLEECIPNLEKVLGHRDLPTKLGIQKREAEQQTVAAIESLIVACEETGDRRGTVKWREALRNYPAINATEKDKRGLRSIPFTVNWWESVGF